MNNPIINMLFNAMRAKGITLPQNININDPNAIAQFLMQNGKITQEQFNDAYGKARRMNSPQQSN